MHSHLTRPPRGTPANIRIHLTYTLYFQKLDSIAYTFVADSMGLPSFKFVHGLQKTHLFCNRVRFGRSRSSKVDDFGTNRKRVCDFLLVRHCAYGLILHSFWDTATFWLNVAYFFLYTSLIRHPGFKGFLCSLWNFESWSEDPMSYIDTVPAWDRHTER